MSFGTIFWSSEPEKIWTVIEEIVAHGVPLVSVKRIALSFDGMNYRLAFQLSLAERSLTG